MEPWMTVCLSLGSGLIAALVTNYATIRVAENNTHAITRHQVLSAAINTAIAEYRAITDAFLQGKGNVIPTPLDMYICHHIVFHFKMNGLVTPSIEELNELLKHTRSTSRQVFNENKDEFIQHD